MMIGVILCGGQSLRMGQDKGLLEWNGLPLVKQIESVLKPFCEKIIISIRAEQEHKYSNLYSKEFLVFDDTGFNIQGPLLGILSSHQRNPKQDLFVIACDMPTFSGQRLKLLHEKYEEKKGYEVYCYMINQFPEPLFAIYSASLLDKVLKKINAGVLGHSSAVRLIQDSNTLFIPSENDLPNFNSPTDIDTFPIN